MKQQIAVLGAGSFGIALAKVLSNNGYSVTLWTRREEIAHSLQQHRSHPHILKQIILPPTTKFTSDLKKAVQDANLIVSAVPMLALRQVFLACRSHLLPETIIVSTTKGIEQETWQFPSQVLSEVLGPTLDNKTAFLSGPSFALEVAQNLPTALVLAAAKLDFCSSVIAVFQNSSLRLSASKDIAGLEVCSAFKNVVAIAAGIIEGLELGANAKAALLTKGLQEVSALAIALGGKAETVYGVAGAGDLVLTCYGQLSRNRSVGMQLALGRSISEILQACDQVAEGLHTAKAVMVLSDRFRLKLPVLQNVSNILFQGMDTKKAVQNMLA